MLNKILFIIFLAAIFFGCQQQNEWTDLLAGPGLTAWTKDRGDWLETGAAFMGPDSNKLIATAPGTGIMVNDVDGRTNNIFTKKEFSNCELHVEFMVPKNSNSGVYLMGRYEIQVLDSWGVTELKHGDCGGIYQRWKDEQGYEGFPPRVNASLAPGEWQSFDIRFKAPQFNKNEEKTNNAKFLKVMHNGIVVHENVEVTGPTRSAAFGDEKPSGPLMLQGDHGPVAFRNIRIKIL
jgi:hypothetical protein